jgi:hypothetical protein
MFTESYGGVAVSIPLISLNIYFSTNQFAFKAKDFVSKSNSPSYDNCSSKKFSDRFAMDIFHFGGKICCE